MCSTLFRSLCRVSSHTHFTLKRKLEVFNVLVTTKLLYGMTTIWLGRADQQKLDGFQNSCLRSIAKIAPAYYSRISNKAVLQTLDQEPLSTKVLRQQLLYLQKVASTPVGLPTRAATFHGDGIRSTTECFVRRVGHPRHTWTDQLLRKGMQLAGSQAEMERRLLNRDSWRAMVSSSTSI